MRKFRTLEVNIRKSIRPNKNQVFVLQIYGFSAPHINFGSPPGRANGSFSTPRKRQRSQGPGVANKKVCQETVCSAAGKPIHQTVGRKPKDQGQHSDFSSRFFFNWGCTDLSGCHLWGNHSLLRFHLKTS